MDRLKVHPTDRTVQFLIPKREASIRLTPVDVHVGRHLLPVVFVVGRKFSDLLRCHTHLIGANYFGSTFHSYYDIMRVYKNLKYLPFTNNELMKDQEPE